MLNSRQRSWLMGVPLCIGMFYLFTLAVSSSGRVDWKTVELESPELENLNFNRVTALSDRIRRKTVDITGVQVTYKECQDDTLHPSSGKTVLLLHGQAFTSKTWQEDIHTTQVLCHYGHRVIAIDLPGFGESQTCRHCRDSRGKAEFLSAFIEKAIGDSKPVIVSPSFSGSYSLPFLQTYQSKASGYVPVAPVQTEQYKDFLADSLVVPTLIVYGERDTSLGTRSAKYLSAAVSSTRPIILEGARHPAYLDQPDKWHQVLVNFIDKL